MGQFHHWGRRVNGSGSQGANLPGAAEACYVHDHGRYPLRRGAREGHPFRVLMKDLVRQANYPNDGANNCAGKENFVLHGLVSLRSAEAGSVLEQGLGAPFVKSWLDPAVASYLRPCVTVRITRNRKGCSLARAGYHFRIHGGLQHRTLPACG